MICNASGRGRGGGGERHLRTIASKLQLCCRSGLVATAYIIYTFISVQVSAVSGTDGHLN